MTTFHKQPNDVLDYDLDMSEWFASIEGDDIETIDITVTSLFEEEPTLVVGPIPHPAYVLIGANPVRAKLWLGGGTDRVNYEVTCVVKTEQDRVKEVEFTVKVRDR